MPRQLGVFAKYWEPGQVKTRLAASIGLEAAAQLQRAFVEATLARLTDAADQRFLVYWPANQQDEFAQLAGPKWSLQPQIEV